MDIEWVREIRNQCRDEGVPLFFKQAVIDGKLVSTPELDGRTWTEFPKLELLKGTNK
jgi:protein gp37